MKRKITWVGLVVTVVAVIAAAAAYAVSGGELAGRSHLGPRRHPGGRRRRPGEHLDCRRVMVVGRHPVGPIGGGGGGGAGEATLQELKITKTIDKASPVLARRCALGQHIQQVVLTVDRPGGSNRPYMQYTLEDVIISSVQQTGSGDAIPIEEVTFMYDRISADLHDAHRRGRSGAIRKRVTARSQAARAEPLRGPLHSARAGSTRGLRGRGLGNGRAHLRGRAPGVARAAARGVPD